MRGNGQNYPKSRGKIKILMEINHIQQDTKGTWPMSLAEVGYRAGCIFS